MALVPACGDAQTDERRAPAETAEDFGPPPPEKSRAALLARLGRPARFLVGHGNDLPDASAGFDFTKAGIYTLPVTPDVHYVYLSGLPREAGPSGPGWPDYEPNGSFVTIIAKNAVERGVLPMFTLYQAAARGERDMDVLRDPDFMQKYWEGARLLFERLRDLDSPALVHFEPDFWGFAQQSAGGGSAADVKALVRGVAECSDLPDDVGGMGRCLVRLARSISPKAAIGFHASGFGAIDRPRRVARFLTECGATEADFVVVDVLDRDAGCFEARQIPECMRWDGPVYWDETNTQSPNFAQHFTWVRTIHERLGLPVLWWQVPLGVPSDVPGGTPKHYRDNRVRYFFDHVPELVEAGGFGMAFGVGAPHQTDITTDGGQFARAVERYAARPVALPDP